MSVRIEALLPVPPALALEEFDEHAREIGFEIETREGGLLIHLSGGDLEVIAEGEATRIRLSAPDMAMLQMLRDYLTEEISKTGLVPEWQGHRAVGRPDSHALVRVVRSERISPSYQRVTVAGEGLARFDKGGLHFRLLFGPQGAAWPEADQNGVTQWPGGAASWHRPVYTIRSLSPDRTELDFDVFLHEGGTVTGWALATRPGDEIVLAGPSGGAGGKPAAWQGFVGDETALPVIARLLEDLPQDAAGQAVLIVREAADIQTLAHPPGVTLHWALREHGAEPLDALDLLQIPAARRSVFFAAEGGEAQEARRILLARGLGKAEISAAAYWIRG